MTAIPLVDLALRPAEADEALAAIRRVLERGWFVLGPEVTAFEEELAAASGVVFCELRRRSGSLLASAGLHWATNGLSVLASAAVWAWATR